MVKSRDQNERARITKLKAMLKKFDDPALSIVCTPVGTTGDLNFLRTMRNVCRASSTGVGLAAPQIGITKQAIYIKPERRGPKEWFMLDPVILDHSEEFERGVEGCLSYPGYTALIDRWTKIQVQYYHVEPLTALVAVKHIATFYDWEARIIQHECDHLNGICLVGDAYRAKKMIP